MWYYSKNGTQQGPLSQEELLQKKQSGEVQPSDLVWRQGMSDWVALSQVAELSGTASPSLSASPTPAASQSYVTSTAPVGKIDNYLWQSIVATVVCCMPFGVVAIVHAAKVDGLVARGAYAEAQAAAKSAKMWVGISVGSFLILFIPYILIVVFGALAQTQGM